jgi:sec-independent protein translocase protein TatB
MFDVGWTEMLVIAIVMIVVVGPKDLPNMLRTFGRTTAKLRAMAGDFQKQFNDALKEAELDDVKKSVDSLRSLNPATEIRKQFNPFEKAAADVRAGLDAAMKPKPAPTTETPAAETPQAVEPLKNGATQMPAEAAANEAPVVSMPSVNGPDAMPAPPAFPPMSETARTETEAVVTKPTESAEARGAKTVKAAAVKSSKLTKAGPAAKTPKPIASGSGSAKESADAKTKRAAMAKTPVSEKSVAAGTSPAPKASKAEKGSSPAKAPAKTAGKIAAGPAAAKKARGGE